MIRKLKELTAPVVLRSLSRFVGRWNYEIRRRPSSLFGSRDRELMPSLSLVLAHHLQKQPDVAFLQIGAFDGRQSDPLYQFITRHHWRGVLVEPMPDAFARLQEAYRGEPQVQLRNVAIARENGTRNLYHLRRDAPGLPTWAPMLASFDRDVVLRHGAQIPHISDLIETTEVRCLTLSTLLAETGLRQIDLLQIDVEGWDFEVLKMVDFTQIKPAIINYEHAHLNADDWDSAVGLLVRNGYRVGIGPFDTVAYLNTGDL
jgi:FkbM family methyltransferase